MKHVHTRSIYDPNCKACRGICQCKQPLYHKDGFCLRCLQDLPKRVIKTLKTFYNPHPGFAGAAIPMPIEVKRVADKLHGKTMPLKEALSSLRAVTKGKLKIVAMDISFIMLTLKEDRHITHGFRVICFR